MCRCQHSLCVRVWYCHTTIVVSHVYWNWMQRLRNAKQTLDPLWYTMKGYWSTIEPQTTETTQCKKIKIIIMIIQVLALQAIKQIHILQIFPKKKKSSALKNPHSRVMKKMYKNITSSIIIINQSTSPLHNQLFTYCMLRLTAPLFFFFCKSAPPLISLTNN